MWGWGGRRKASGSHCEEDIFQRKGFFIEERLLLILREKDYNSGKVADG